MLFIHPKKSKNQKRKNNNMKRIFLTIAIAIAALLPMSADDSAVVPGEQAVAVEYAFASHHGLHGIGFQYHVGLPLSLRLEPEFIYYFKNGDTSCWNANLNVVYVTEVATTFTLYPYAGVACMHNGYGKSRHDATRYGMNLGCGAEFNITSQVAFFIEEKFQFISHESQAVTQAGFRYFF